MVQERKGIFWRQRSSNSPVQAHEEVFICPYWALRVTQAVKVREEAIEQPQRQNVPRAWSFNLQRQERCILVQPAYAISSGKLAWHVSTNNAGDRHSRKFSVLPARQVSATQYSHHNTKEEGTLGKQGQKNAANQCCGRRPPLQAEPDSQETESMVDKASCMRLTHTSASRQAPFPR